MEFYDEKKEIFSPLFEYWCERKEENTIPEDSGASIADSVNVLAHYGICRESVYPFDPAKFAQTPPPSAMADAAMHKALGVQQVSPDLHSIKTVLAAGKVIQFGFVVYSYFESEKMAKTGVLRMPKHNEKELGGHAVLAVGYDDSKQCIISKNSWSDSWGLEGYFYMPFDYVCDKNLASDMWTISGVTQPPPALGAVSPAESPPSHVPVASFDQAAFSQALAASDAWSGAQIRALTDAMVLAFAK